MKKKIYKLNDNLRYDIPADNSSKSANDFRTYINKRKLKRMVDARNKYIKKHKKPKRMNDWIFILLLMSFYYLLIGLIMLLKNWGFR